MTLGGDLLPIHSRSAPDPLSILSLLLAKTHHMGIRSRSAPDPLPKFSKSLTFDSNSTSDDESDVLKGKLLVLLAVQYLIKFGFVKKRRLWPGGGSIV